MGIISDTGNELEVVLNRIKTLHVMLALTFICSLNLWFLNVYFVVPELFAKHGYLIVSLVALACVSVVSFWVAGCIAITMSLWIEKRKQMGIFIDTSGEGVNNIILSYIFVYVNVIHACFIVIQVCMLFFFPDAGYDILFWSAMVHMMVAFILVVRMMKPFASLFGVFEHFWGKKKSEPPQEPPLFRDETRHGQDTPVDAELVP